MPRIPKHRLAELSTAHITLEDSRHLARCSGDHNGPLTVFEKSEYGWYVSIPDEKEVLSEMAHFGFSYPFIAILRKLRKRKFMLLCLDRDGDVIDGLPTFNW